MNLKKSILLTISSLGLCALQQTSHAQDLTPSGYGKNNILFTPFSATDHGLGFAVSYERILNKEGNVSMVLPFQFILDSYENNYYNNNNNQKIHFYFTPGIKFYTAGIKRNNFAVGPSLLFSSYKGNRTTYNYPDNTIEEVTNTQFGILAKAYYQLNITNHFNFNVDGGFGMLYIDNYKNNNITNNEGTKATVNFNVSFGYRF